jgi:hypothetical protein
MHVTKGESQMATSKPAKSVLLLAAMLISAMLVAANPPVTMDIPMDITDFDTCSGEDVHLSGTAEFSMSVTMDSNRAHIVGHVNEHLKGNGLSSGASYVADAMGDVVSNVDIDPVTHTGMETIMISAYVNGQGSIPNTSARQLVHVTVNANGDITATVSDFRFVCQ